MDWLWKMETKITFFSPLDTSRWNLIPSKLVLWMNLGIKQFTNLQIYKFTNFNILFVFRKYVVKFYKWHVFYSGGNFLC